MKPVNRLTGLSSIGQKQLAMPTLIIPAEAPIEQTTTDLRSLQQPVSTSQPHKKFIRHILLGEPDAIRQTIHLLHTLRYTETILWTPILDIEEPLMITPAQSEAISLLRKQL